MKYQIFIAAAVVLAVGACKTPYRATDQPKTTTDSTASIVDTSSAIKPMATPPDSVAKPVMDSTVMDTSMRQIPDSAKMKPVTDTVAKQPVIDSVRDNPQVDSAQKQEATDSVKTSTTISGKAQPATTAPTVAEAAFNKQYPGASDVVWSAYDSLAAIPIDMRLTGWKKMKSEDHMVKFNYKDEAYYAWYDSKGKFIGSATPIPIEDVNKLPAAVKTAVNNAIKTRYAGYTVSQVNRETQAGKKSYEVELTKDESKVRMLVSATGKIGQIYRYTAEKK
jgi:hypothetical protein